jgi:hypothetical protein
LNELGFSVVPCKFAISEKSGLTGAASAKR